MRANITATGIAFGLLVMWAARLPLVASGGKASVTVLIHVNEAPDRTAMVLPLSSRDMSGQQQGA
jgi:hypothetical protein